MFAGFEEKTGDDLTEKNAFAFVIKSG